MIFNTIVWLAGFGVGVVHAWEALACEANCSTSELWTALALLESAGTPSESYLGTCVGPKSQRRGSDDVDILPQCKCLVPFAEELATTDGLSENFTLRLKFDSTSLTLAASRIDSCAHWWQSAHERAHRMLFSAVIQPLRLKYGWALATILSVIQPWREEYSSLVAVTQLQFQTRSRFYRAGKLLLRGCLMNLFANTCSFDHLAAFLKLPPAVGPAPKGHFLDFLGIATDESLFCNTYRSGWGGYAPNRYFECMGHSSGMWRQQWPILDEEYFEWSDILAAVLSATDRGQGFAIAEVGSGSYAMWSIRAAVAFNRIASASASCDVLAVEPFSEGFPEEMHRHVARNLPEGRCRISSSKAKVGATVSLHSILDGAHAQVPIWDLVDMDVQGFELQVLRAELHALYRRARALHISTHTRDWHFEIVGRLRAAAWTIRFDIAPGSAASIGKLGPIVCMDGHISAMVPLM